MLALITKWVKKNKPPIVSKITLTSNKYKDFNILYMSKVFSSDMSIKQITVYKPTIEAYIVFIKLLIKFLEEDKQLSNLQVLSEVKTIYIRDFFIDSKHNYLNPEETFTEFKTLVSYFLDLYRTKEETVDPSFIIQINLRLTSGVVNNLTSLIESLI